MTARHALVHIVALLAIGACAPTHAGAHDETALRQKAHALWERNMLVVDESVAFWKGRTGTAPHTAEDLTAAIDFFEVVTGLAGRVNSSFIGPIPDESLEAASREWKAWYAAHGGRLTYDESQKRVILQN